ncbi:MAG TPA: hypothetical protein VF311_15415, partial [Terriglobales bacterium]
MTAGGSHLHDAGHYFDRCVPPERKWREPTQWTRTNVRVNRLSYTSRPDAIRRSQFATDEAVLYLQGVFSPDEERSAGEPQAEVQPVDEGQAAHELQSPDEERSAGEPQAEVQSVDELQAAHGVHSAHGLPYSHSCE